MMHMCCQKICSKFVVFFLFGFAGCTMPSRISMEGEGGRTSYNNAIQMTNSQQMLLNLVRLRYADSPLFLDVSSITTQSTVRSELAPVFSIPGFSKDNPFKLGGDISWQDQPTITYTPLEGQAFATRLLRPIDLRTLQLLCYSGWDIDRVFWMMVQNFQEIWNDPDSEDASQPAHQRFSEVSHLLRHFQKRGELQLGVQINPKTEKDQDLHEHSLQIAFPVDGVEGSRLAELIKCDQLVNGRYLKNVELGFSNGGHMGVMPRSIFSCMAYLSRGVQVPQEHIDRGMVRISESNHHEEEEWGEVFRGLIAVRWNRFAPKNAFIAVQYRNYWFYIDDCDMHSKKTFALLLQLYNLNANEANIRGPILTLPLG
ncbi:MAG: hypothetical protein HW387_18 [Parachlamydiales bacterium]|nr:hypothetical protein [Parachlamydiales bacterium]